MAEAIFGTLITGFLGLIAWVGNRQIKRLDVVEKTNNDIKYNYLDRFGKQDAILARIEQKIDDLKKEKEDV